MKNAEIVTIHTNCSKHMVKIRTSPSKPQVICTPRRRAMTVYPGRGPPNSYPQTPPPTLLSSESQIIADQPRLTAPVQPQLNKITSWIITELEASVITIPQINLQLNSPVILQICLPAEQRRVPRQTLPTLPLSRYLNFSGPISSHPTHPSLEFHLQAASPPFSPTEATNLRSLRTVFPHASSQLLSSLQASYLALHYISTIRLPSPSSCSAACLYTEPHSPLSPNMPYIPAKARAMLGLQTPTARPGLPASWTRPETRGWRERIENLQCKLEREVVRFIRMCEGSDLGKNEALVRAVGEIIDAGQGNARRLS